RDPRSYTLGETIMAWQHALHAGEGLGWTWKILVFLSGFLPPLFAVTGVSMWLIKRRNRRRAALQAHPAD
ncbi:MAG: PepSY domain-containing protein, partial [Planctomycetia bacterium]|nr:PepSY domain-containing protein [Planctomycetia bacterium]